MALLRLCRSGLPMRRSNRLTTVELLSLQLVDQVLLKRFALILFLLLLHYELRDNLRKITVTL